jgi:hypothetical protein
MEEEEKEDGIEKFKKEEKEKEEGIEDLKRKRRKKRGWDRGI